MDSDSPDSDSNPVVEIHNSVSEESSLSETQSNTPDEEVTNIKVSKQPVPTPRPRRIRRQPSWMTKGDYVVGKFEQHVGLLQKVLETYSTVVNQMSVDD